MDKIDRIEILILNLFGNDIFKVNIYTKILEYYLYGDKDSDEITSKILDTVLKDIFTKLLSVEFIAKNGSEVSGPSYYKVVSELSAEDMVNDIKHKNLYMFESLNKDIEPNIPSKTSQELLEERKHYDLRKIEKENRQNAIKYKERSSYIIDPDYSMELDPENFDSNGKYDIYGLDISQLNEKELQNIDLNSQNKYGIICEEDDNIKVNTNNTSILNKIYFRNKNSFINLWEHEVTKPSAPLSSKRNRKTYG